MDVDESHLGDRQSSAAPARTCTQLALHRHSHDTSSMLRGPPATSSSGFEGNYTSRHVFRTRHSVVDLDLKVGGSIDFDSMLAFTQNRR